MADEARGSVLFESERNIVDDLAEETGNLFRYWAENHLDMDQMVAQYFDSHLRENVDKRYARCCTQAWDEMAQQFPPVKGNQVYDPTLCEWLGHFYTYLQSYTRTSSRELIHKYSFKTMYPRSNVLHDLDMDVAVRMVEGT